MQGHGSVPNTEKKNTHKICFTCYITMQLHCELMSQMYIKGQTPQENGLWELFNFSCFDYNHYYNHDKYFNHYKHYSNKINKTALPQRSTFLFNSPSTYRTKYVVLN